MSLWNMAEGTQITGTVEATGTAVTGTASAFTSDVNVGDMILIDGEEHRVASVANTSSLTLESSHSGTSTAVAAYVSKKPLYLTEAEAIVTFGVDNTEMAVAKANTSIAHPQHSGWVIRIDRGADHDPPRYIYETLVAGGMSGDAEDTVFPDA